IITAHLRFLCGKPRRPRPWQRERKKERDRKREKERK
ncbi:PREDICTED: uncharacterized protein LOC106819754, partial [Priapulus caudatus]|uniref:Uncharacterized protein LOC106819754 n=1 Tax=Priapulus caudatus TaxID=37621 RepID=A0ABM1F5W1_PRICU